MLLVCDIDLAFFDEYTAKRDRNGDWVCPMCGCSLRHGDIGLFGPEDMFLPYADYR